MSDDWKPGDLALCVRGARRTRAGGVYTVYRVAGVGAMCGCGHPLEQHFGVCLWFEGVGTPDASGCEPWASASRFRKIRPHTPDAEDAEVIALLNGAGVKEASDA